MALGVDVEVFVKREGEETVIPALLALESVREDFDVEHIYKDIEGPDFPGYDSLYIELESGQVAEDGAALETPCNPGDNSVDVIDNLKEPVQTCIKIAEAQGAQLVAAPLVWLDPEHLQLRNELRVLGCDPDLDIWHGGGVLCKPKQDAEHTLWRTGGGHVHFSPFNIHLPIAQEYLILWCDLILGTLDVILEHSADGVMRREMYGQPGKHRVRDYGVEYRTCSNVWFTHPALAKLVLDLSSLIHALVEEEADLDGDPWLIINKIGWRKMVTTILECDLYMAGKIFMYVMEVLDQWGLDIEENLDMDLIHELYTKGGVRNLYGESYVVRGW